MIRRWWPYLKVLMRLLWLAPAFSAAFFIPTLLVGKADAALYVGLVGALVGLFVAIQLSRPAWLVLRLKNRRETGTPR